MKLTPPDEPNRFRSAPVSFRLTENAYRMLRILHLVFKRPMSSLIEEMVDKSAHTARKAYPDAFREAEVELDRVSASKKKKKS